MKKAWMLLGAVFIIAVAYYLISPAFRIIEVQEESPLGMDPATQNAFDQAMAQVDGEVSELDEAMPTASILAQGVFVPSAHDVKGSAVLIDTPQGRVVRFEDFETINGPDLHIYLSRDLAAGDYIELGPIKATRGNVNYAVPAEVDLLQYNKVLVWCEPFRVLFSYAELR